jgi:outer membrane protein TolC
VRTLEITNAQYQAGTVGYLSVTSAQSAALSSQITLVSVQTRLLNATNVLLKNAAGTWDTGASPKSAT